MRPEPPTTGGARVAAPGSYPASQGADFGGGRAISVFGAPILPKQEGPVSLPVGSRAKRGLEP